MKIMPFDDISGKRFGRLIAKNRSGKKWICACDCGNQKLINPSSLKRGLTKSCGCLNRELSSDRNRVDKRTHGKSLTSEFKIWQGMRQRCENPKAKDYPRYGGRGIRVCDRWGTFEKFLADMGRRPSKFHSTERDDVNGDYEPLNCRWATSKEQSRNKRNTIRISAFGREGCLADFVEPRSSDYDRARKLIKRGIDGEKAVFAVLSARF